MSGFQAGAAVVGTGLQIYGGIEAMGAQKNITKISMEEIGVEKQQNEVRRQAMEMSAHRQMLQQVRNTQKARSQALETGTSQGAQFGSGVAGAYGSISGQGSSNIAELSSGLQFGEQEFNLTAQLDDLKMSMAKAQGQLATAQGISAIGSGISGASKSFG